MLALSVQATARQKVGHDLASLELRLGEHDWRLGTSGRSTTAVRKQSNQLHRLASAVPALCPGSWS